MSRMIQANTRTAGVQASNTPTSIAVAVVIMAPLMPGSRCQHFVNPNDSSSIALLFLVGDSRLGTFVEPFPIGFVAFPLAFVGFAAARRTKLLEAQAEAD